MSAPGARRIRGRSAHAAGMAAEDAVVAVLQAEGWLVHARRLRTPAGEIDIVAERAGLLALIEVKSRATLAEAAAALRPRQRARLMAAAEIVLAEHPDWGAAGVRFDALLVGRDGMRRIADAFRQGDDPGWS